LELVRYIHLNPLRAGIVEEPEALGAFPYCGHSALMGKTEYGFQDVNYVLNLFDEKPAEARRRYLEFVRKGIPEGRRHDLTGGGLVRSAGGWTMLNSMRRSEDRMKGDERILGRGDFVESVLKSAQENLERRHVLRARGYDFEWLLSRVTDICGLTPRELLTGGKQRKTVTARSVLCYWGTRELGMTAIGISKYLNIAASTVSESVARGQRIIKEQGLKLLDDGVG
jgi:putative transposase